jgi:hypothetical protein
MVVPRLIWLAAVAGLAGTIVGLPIALWLSIRWFFVEEAVILDGKSAFTALGGSAQAVAGRAGRAALLIAFFAGSASILGALVASLLFFLTPWPLWIVNAIAGLAHLLVVPYASIGLCLSYGDLRARAEADEDNPSRGLLGWPGQFISASLRIVEWRRRS